MMPLFSAIVLDYPQGLWLALPALGVVVFGAWQQRRQGMAWGRVVTLGLLRGTVLMALVGLAARPVWVSRAAAAGSRSVTVLVDASESMGLEEDNESRFKRAVGFARNQLVPALASTGIGVQLVRFDEQAQAAELEGLRSVKPGGRRTNLGGAVAQAVGSLAQPPLAVIALTDGIVNETKDNNRALADLLDSGTPFIGVGFGSDLGANGGVEDARGAGVGAGAEHVPGVGAVGSG